MPVASDAAERARERHQRLIVQRDRPCAAHALAHRGIGRLQRVVPVAVAVGGERGAGDDAPAISASARSTCCQPLPARRLALRADRRTARVSSSTPPSPVAIRYCASASSGQNTMSPCESPARMLRSRSKNMNHCGQSPSGVLRRNTRSSRSRTGAERPSASSSSTGPWRHIARAPATARVLFEPARRR